MSARYEDDKKSHKINFIEMSRRGPANKMNTSMGGTTISNSGPTVVSAIRKLK